MPGRKRRSFVQENTLKTPTRSSFDSTLESPHWVSGNDVVFNTPSTWSPIKTRRRTTMIQEEITATRNEVILRTKGKVQIGDSDFKVPSMMFSSPPGVKTRNRRSSVYVAASNPARRSSVYVAASNTAKQSQKNSSNNAQRVEKQTKTVTAVKRAGKQTPRNVNKSKLTKEKVLLSSPPLRNKKNGPALPKGTTTRHAISKKKEIKNEPETTKQLPKATKRKSTEIEKVTLQMSPQVERINVEVLNQSSKKSKRQMNSKAEKSKEIEESLQSDAEEIFTTIKTKTPKSVLKHTPKSTLILKTPGKNEKQLSSVSQVKTTRTRSTRKSESLLRNIDDGNFNDNNSTPKKIVAPSSTNKPVSQVKTTRTKSTRKSESLFKNLDNGSFNDNNSTPKKIVAPSSSNKRKSLRKDKLQNSVLTELKIASNKEITENRTHLEERMSVLTGQENIDEFIMSDEQNNSLDKTDLNMTLSRSSSSKWCTIL